MLVVIGNKCIKCRGWMDMDSIAKRMASWRMRMEGKGANKFTMRVLSYTGQPEGDVRWCYLFCEALQVIK